MFEVTTLAPLTAGCRVTHAPASLIAHGDIYYNTEWIILCFQQQKSDGMESVGKVK